MGLKPGPCYSLSISNHYLCLATTQVLFVSAGLKALDSHVAVTPVTRLTFECHVDSPFEVVEFEVLTKYMTLTFPSRRSRTPWAVARKRFHVLLGVEPAKQSASSMTSSEYRYTFQPLSTSSEWKLTSGKGDVAGPRAPWRHPNSKPILVLQSMIDNLCSVVNATRSLRSGTGKGLSRKRWSRFCIDE